MYVYIFYTYKPPLCLQVHTSLLLRNISLHFISFIFPFLYSLFSISFAATTTKSSLSSPPPPSLTHQQFPTLERIETRYLCYIRGPARVHPEWFNPHTGSWQRTGRKGRNISFPPARTREGKQGNRHTDRQIVKGRKGRTNPEEGRKGGRKRTREREN